MSRRPPLTRAEAAEYLNVSPRWIKRAIEERRLPYLKLGRLVRFDLDDLDRWLDAQRVEPREGASR